MLVRADAAILIGDPALMALEERANRFERTGEELVYHDLAEEWRTLTGLPFVSAVWGAAPKIAGAPGLDSETGDSIAATSSNPATTASRTSMPWSLSGPRSCPLSEQTIHAYLTTNIHYVLDDECLEAMKVFFRMAAQAGALPEYSFSVSELTSQQS